jgi:Dirigent-like protein
VIDSDAAFTVIGDEGGKEFLDLGVGGAGNIGTYDEILYEAVSPDSWEKGDEVGRAHAFFVITPNDHAVVTITLHFGDDESDDSLTAHGALPRDGNDVGRGVLSVAGGTGRFKNRGGQLRVDVMNPHKYSAEP